MKKIIIINENFTGEIYAYIGTNRIVTYKVSQLPNNNVWLKLKELKFEFDSPKDYDLFFDIAKLKNEKYNRVGTNIFYTKIAKNFSRVYILDSVYKTLILYNGIEQKEIEKVKFGDYKLKPTIKIG